MVQEGLFILFQAFHKNQWMKYHSFIYNYQKEHDKYIMHPVDPSTKPDLPTLPPYGLSL